jgi:hypothetical protein
LKFVVMSSEGHLSHNPPSFLLSFFLVGKCCFVCFLSVCVAMDLGLADWLDLIRSCAVSSTSSCPQHLVDFQPTRVVKSAATAKRGHFHTGTLSPWQLLLTLAQLCSSRALQVAPGRLIHSGARGEGAALFYIYSIEPASALLFASHTRTAIFNVSSSLDSSRTGEKPLEDATLHKFPLSSHFTSS